MRPHLSKSVTSLMCSGPDVKSLMVRETESHIPPNLHTQFHPWKCLCLLMLIISTRQLQANSSVWAGKQQFYMRDNF